VKAFPGVSSGVDLFDASDGITDLDGEVLHPRELRTAVGSSYKFVWKSL
jgi:hypothetical protein